MVDAVAILLRALSFIALFQAAGAVVFLLLYGEALPVCRAPILGTARRAAIIAALLVLAHYVSQSAQLAGDFTGVLDSSLQRLLWHSPAGSALCLRVGGLALVLAGLGHWRPLSLAGLVLIVASFLVIGHTVGHAHRAVLAVLLVFHLLAVLFWFGSLWPLRQVVAREAPVFGAALLERFSHHALWIVLMLPVAGAGLMLLLVPGLAVFTHAYGELLLAKVGGFVVLMGVAALNKLRLTPALSRHEAAAASKLQHSLLIEYLLVGAVLVITAVMSGLYSPD